MATGKNINELTQNTELDDSDLLLVGNKGTGSLRQITVEDAENSALGYDSGDDTSPTAWEDVDKIESSEKAPSLFKKLTTMAKNVRWLFSKMGTTDISKIGDGTVMGALTSLNDGLTTNTSDIASINSALTNIDDFSSVITVGEYDDAEYFAYAKAGWAYMRVRVQAESGEHVCGYVPQPYRPYATVYGWESITSQYASYGYFRSCRITTDGTIYAWLYGGSFVGKESIIFVYPIA